MCFFSLFFFFQGCSSPLVVKFADTPKDKETKKIQQQFTNQNNNLIHMPPGNSMVIVKYFMNNSYVSIIYFS